MNTRDYSRRSTTIENVGRFAGARSRLVKLTPNKPQQWARSIISRTDFKFLGCIMIVAFSAVPVSAAETNLAAVASNELGLDLYRQAAKGDSSLCLAIDEKGMEAAAATAVSMGVAMAARPQEPLEIRVDRPFLFAIQHVPTGTCLFLGRVTDPR